MSKKTWLTLGIIFSVFVAGVVLFMVASNMIKDHGVKKEVAEWKRGFFEDVFPPILTYCDAGLTEEQCQAVGKASQHIEDGLKHLHQGKSKPLFFPFRGRLLAEPPPSMYLVVKGPSKEDLDSGGACFDKASVLGRLGYLDRFPELARPTRSFHAVICFNKLSKSKTLQIFQNHSERRSVARIVHLGLDGVIAHEMLHSLLGYANLDYQHPVYGCDLMCSTPVTKKIGIVTQGIIGRILQQQVEREKK